MRSELRTASRPQQEGRNDLNKSPLLHRVLHRLHVYLDHLQHYIHKELNGYMFEIHV